MVPKSLKTKTRLQQEVVNVAGLWMIAFRDSLKFENILINKSHAGFIPPVPVVQCCTDNLSNFGRIKF